ncbi:MAG: DUF1801 domain-containing protein [Anaerolineales bacterium]|jgi:hypothetical protein
MTKTVDGYIDGLQDWRAEVVSNVRQLILEAAPEAAEALKWAQPVYEHNGPFCYIKAFKQHVNFGFWRGAELPDPAGLLQGAGEKMRHVKLSGLEDIKPGAFQDLVRAAVQMNIEKGDPTKGA